jgi:hypothetical protein
MFSTVSVIYGITGSINTPVIIPFFAKCSIASNLFVVVDTNGSIFIHVSSSEQVIEKLTLAGECSFMSNKISVSRFTKSLFVIMHIPNLNALINSKAFLVSLCFSSSGLYGSDTPPVNTTPVFFFLRRLSRIIRNASCFALIQSKLSVFS